MVGTPASLSTHTPGSSDSREYSRSMVVEQEPATETGAGKQEEKDKQHFSITVFTQL